MHPGTVGLFLLLLLLLLHPLSSSHLEEEEEVPVEVIVDSSSCSTTCGIGVKTQTLCVLRDGQTAMEEGVSRADGAQVSENCRVRTVRCRQAWQCGLRTVTVTSGQRVEMDCVGDVVEVMGRFSWRVSWRLARGIISSDDSFFSRWDAPQLARVILDPVREEDAGTYRCDVQDASFRRVKRVYFGVRVLPAGVLNLDGVPPDQQQSNGNRTNDQEQDCLDWPCTTPERIVFWCAGILLACMVIMILLWLFSNASF